MKSTKALTVAGIILAVGMFLSPHVVYGDESNEALQKQVKELQQKVEVLEKALQQKTSSPYRANRLTHRKTWDPFAEMDRIQEEMNRLFKDSYFRGFGQDIFDQKTLKNPDLDIHETDTRYIAKLDLPGMEKSDINVEVKGQQLIVSGEKKEEHVEENKEDNYYRRERSFGSFSRTFPLPENADRAAIDAEYNDGVLTVNIAKLAPTKEKVKGTKVTVK